MTEKIEQFYQSLYSELTSKLGTYIYKEVDIVPLRVKFYLNTIINSTIFLSRIEKVTSDKQMELLVERYFEGFFKPEKNKLKLVFKDVFRFLYHRLFNKSAKSDADFFVFVTNKKFFSFIKPIQQELEQQGKKVDFIVWDKNDSGTNIAHLPKTEFPAFWQKGYCENHEYTTLIDRARGFLPLLKNKKLIVIEGDLESHHILGLLGQKNQFQTYCTQWGFHGKTATKPGWRDMPFDKLLVWGDFFADSFKPTNPKLSIISSGHPALNENEISEKGKTILFAVQKPFGEHIPKEDVIGFIHFAAKTAMQMTDYKIIVRSHPDFEIPQDIKTEYESVSNIIWHDYKNFSMGQSFGEAKYSVSISSAASLESIAYGCYPVYLKINDLPLQIHQIMAGNPEHQHVFDAENFVPGIQNLEMQDHKNYLAGFRNRLYKNLGAAAIRATVAEMNT